MVFKPQLCNSGDLRQTYMLPVYKKIQKKSLTQQIQYYLKNPKPKQIVSPSSYQYNI